MVRPESARTGAMNTTRVAMPVYWQRKNRPQEMPREWRKGLDVSVDNLSEKLGGLSLASNSSSSASQFQELPRTQTRLALAFSAWPCSANHCGDSGMIRRSRSRKGGSARSRVRRDPGTRPVPNFFLSTQPVPTRKLKLTWYDSFSDVGESRVWWRADFQSGSRVLKKVF